jgi:hypothetical protein
MKVGRAGRERSMGTPMEHAIAEMERRRYEAMKQADIATLHEALDDLLVYAHSNSVRRQGVLPGESADWILSL